MRLMRYLGGREALHSDVRKASRGEVMRNRPHRLMYVVWADSTFLVVCSSTLQRVWLGESTIELSHTTVSVYTTVQSIYKYHTLNEMALR